MILLIIAVIIVFMIGVGIWWHFDDDGSGIPPLLQTVLIIALVVCISYAIALSITYADGMVIDDTIALYHTENDKIEQQMSILVSEYMEYETGTFEDLKIEDAVTLINLYPELKADKLVSKQLEVYVSNRLKIIELETQKLNLKVTAFWLFLH